MSQRDCEISIVIQRVNVILISVNHLIFPHARVAREMSHHSRHQWLPHRFTLHFHLFRSPFLPQSANFPEDCI